MAHDVFISYSKEDIWIANRVCATLKTKDITYWIATEDIVAGDMFDEAILKGIEHSRCVILIFSSHADKSRHVKRELHIASELQRPIIPFRVENTEPSRLRYYLTGVQWQEALTRRLDESLERLAETIQARLGRKGGVPLGAKDAPATQGLSRPPKVVAAALIATLICGLIVLTATRKAGVVPGPPAIAPPNGLLANADEVERQDAQPGNVAPQQIFEPMKMNDPERDKPQLQALEYCERSKGKNKTFLACQSREDEVVIIEAINLKVLGTKRCSFKVVRMRFIPNKSEKPYLHFEGAKGEEDMWP